MLLSKVGRTAGVWLASLLATAAATATPSLAGPRFDWSEPFRTDAQLCGAGPVAPEPGVVRVRFMGVSTLLIEDSQTQLLVDGFLSRPHWLTLKFLAFRPNIPRIKAALCRGGVRKPTAILTAHAHFDHAMDSAVIVANLGGKLVGSESVANIGLGRELSPGQMETFAGRRRWRMGCFEVTAVPAPHGSPDRWEGGIVAPLRPPVKAGAYRNGGSFSYLIERPGVRLLVHPSAGSFPGLYPRNSADIVFLGVGGLGKKDAEATDALWSAAVLETGASTVYPIHWDNLSRPLNKPLTPVPLFDDVDKTLKRLRRQPDADKRLRQPMEAFQSVTFLLEDSSHCDANDAMHVVSID